VRLLLGGSFGVNRVTTEDAGIALYKPAGNLRIRSENIHGESRSVDCANMEREFLQLVRLYLERNRLALDRYRMEVFAQHSENLGHKLGHPLFRIQDVRIDEESCFCLRCDLKL
jgi:hypothetical protein